MERLLLTRCFCAAALLTAAGVALLIYLSE